MRITHLFGVLIILCLVGENLSSFLGGNKKKIQQEKDAEIIFKLFRKYLDSAMAAGYAQNLGFGVLSRKRDTPKDKMDVVLAILDFLADRNSDATYLPLSVEVGLKTFNEHKRTCSNGATYLADWILGTMCDTRYKGETKARVIIFVGLFPFANDLEKSELYERFLKDVSDRVCANCGDLQKSSVIEAFKCMVRKFIELRSNFCDSLATQYLDVCDHA